MKNKQETFADLMLQFRYQYDLRGVFDDFLTLTLCAFSQNLQTCKSYDEDLYMETIGKYKKQKELQALFPKMLSTLIMEMEERFDSSSGNDVLGGFYEEHLYRKGAQQFFTPWHVCDLIAKMSAGDSATGTERTKCILDPCCGSGRLLVTGVRHLGTQNAYYGIDIDHTCVKVTAINLFLNGIFNAEVMCADALQPEDFRMSYRISFLPFGIFRIAAKEGSRLWHMVQHAKLEKRSDGLILPSQNGSAGFGQDTSQLKLF